MADQKRIKLYQGHATPSTIILRALPVADVSTGTVIRLRALHATPKTIVLRALPDAADAGGGGTVTGTLAVTLAGLALSGVGTVPVSASAGATFDGLTLAGAAAVAVSGTASMTLANMALSGVASVRVTATLNMTLGGVTLSGSGTVTGGTANTQYVGAGLEASSVRNRSKYRYRTFGRGE